MSGPFYLVVLLPQYAGKVSIVEISGTVIPSSTVRRAGEFNNDFSADFNI